MTFLPSFRPALSWRELGAALRAGRRPGGSEEFARALERYLDVPHAVAAHSARWGLYHLLRGLGLREGDEVLVPALTYFAVPAAVVRAGLKPVFVDIQPDSLAIDPEAARRSVTGRTRAVIPTHLSGFICDLAAVCALARERGLTVIEDCAQSLGGAFRGRRAGAWGEAAYFTFGVTKHMTTLGGAMVVARDEVLARGLRRAAQSPVLARLPAAALLKAAVMKCATSGPGFPLTYAGLRLCAGAGLDAVDLLFAEPPAQLGEPRAGAFHPAQSALGLLQLASLDARNQRRRERALQLYGLLRAIPGVRVPRSQEGAEDVFSSCPVFVPGKERARQELLRRGIDSSLGYLQDCSALEMFAEQRRECPNAARAKREVLYLPLYEELAESDVELVADRLRRALRGA
ncbi:MAG: DegT/DnrJ/EryC1/StrS family aminotransferase [Elusimicrobia bacterium]|nr:DegT/DnrJ/EryC1/StrS family aminotransferase [Elusimicrobiota bacterium]